MVTKVLLLVVICFLAHQASAAIIGCDPFPAASRFISSEFTRDFHATCPNSLIVWTTQQEGLEVSAAMDNCASATTDFISSASVFLSDSPYKMFYVINISANANYYFDYSLKWTQKDTFCVVTLTGSAVGASEVVPLDNIIDQNGLSNSPLEDLSSVAVNQWYTRSFLINGSTLGDITSLRFGFSCAANLSTGSARIQRAFVEYIRFHEVNRNYTQVLYNHRQNCTSCEYDEPPLYPLEVYCNETKREWTLDGPINLTSIELGPASITLNGDLFTDNLVLSPAVYTTLTILGCIYPSTPGGVVNVYPRDLDFHSVYYIYIDDDCSIDSWNVSSAFEVTRFPDYDVSTICSYCNFSDDDDYSSHYLSDDAVIILAVLVPFITAAGVVVALVFGIKKYKANVRGKQQRDKEETEMTPA